jgi:basic membrane lipoprotein Med (substrate-binding protein (PBP1-ABC) superfamily)
MEEASLKTRTRVQYLPAFGPSTVPNALPYLASLVQQHCDIVVAAGDVPSATVANGAGRFPKTKFLVVGGAHSLGNVATVNAAPDALHTAVANAITDAVHSSAS